MTLTSKRIAAAVTLALMLLPNASYAKSSHNNNDCSSSQSDDCDDDKREKPKFQTKFFSE